MDDISVLPWTVSLRALIQSINLVVLTLLRATWGIIIGVNGSWEGRETEQDSSSRGQKRKIERDGCRCIET